METALKELKDAILGTGNGSLEITVKTDRKQIWVSYDDSACENGKFDTVTVFGQVSMLPREMRERYSHETGFLGHVPVTELRDAFKDIPLDGKPEMQN